MLTNKLCKACEDGNTIVVEQLLASGATPNFASSGNGYRYPLHYAADSGHVDVVKLLLQVHWVSFISPQENEAAVDPLESSNAWTPLMIAALKSRDSPGHVAVIMALLEAGADVEITDAKGNTVLHILASLGHTKLIQCLLELFPSLDVLGPGFGYLTPLHYATEAGHLETAEFLLQQGADPRGVDASGWTPMHWACRRGRKQVIDRLLFWGGSIEDRDFRSLTPVDVAALFGHVAMAKLLEAQMPKSCSMNLALPIEVPALKKEGESRGCNTPDDQLSKGAGTQSRPQSLSPIFPGTPELHKSLPFAWDWSAFFCCFLGFFIVALSVYDYASRVSLVALIAATARTVQGTGPALTAAATLVCASIVLPSVALGVCCGCHLRTTWSWAAWRAAAAFHLFAAPVDGEGKGATRQMRPFFQELLVVHKFNLLWDWLAPPGTGTAVRLANACCILPIVAVAFFLLLWVQLMIAAAAASSAVLTTWVCNALGFVVSKALLVHNAGLLICLDCLTHGTALQLISANPGVEKWFQNQHAEMSPLSESEPPQDGSALEPQCRTEAQHGDIGLSHSLRSLSSSRFGQELHTIGEEAAECESVSVDCKESSSAKGCSIPLEGTAVSQRRADASLKKHQSMRETAFYSRATLAGSIPPELHPCRSFRGAILLHRQHFKGCRDNRCTSLRSEHREGDRRGSGSVSSGSKVGAAVGKRAKPSEPSASPHVTDGWRFHGSSGGLLADSLRSVAEPHDSTPIIGNETKKKYWSSGLEGGSPVIRGSADCSSDRSPSRTPVSSGLLPFAYSGSLRGVDPASDCTGEGHSAAASRHSHAYSTVQDAVPRWNDKASVRTESVASLLAGSSPYGWMRRQMKRQHDASSCPQASPSFRTYVTRVSRPGIPNVATWSKGKPNRRVDSQHKPSGASPCNYGGRAGWLGHKLLFFRHAPQQDTDTDASEGERRPIGKPGSSWGIQLLKKRKQRPVAAQLDDAEYDDLVLRREQRIFDWFERLVAFRYAEVKRMRRAAAAQISGSSSESLHRHGDIDSAEALPSSGSGPSPRHDGRGNIRWSSFNTLFPQDSCLDQPQGGQAGDKPDAPRPVESEVVACIQTEELFDWTAKEASTPRSWLLHPGKRRRDQQRGLPFSDALTWRSLVDCPKLADSPSAAEKGTATDGSSTRGDSIPDQLLPPVIHYRFRDMIEMPQLREAFFSFWSREFEKLIVYQDQYFGDNPLWIGNLLEEDSLSDFSQERLFSPRATKRSPFAPSHCHQESTEPSSNVRPGAHVLWLVPQRAPKSKEDDCASQSLGGEGTCCPACDDMLELEGRSGICTCQGLPEPPMTCIVAMDLGKVEAYKRLVIRSTKNPLPSRESAHHSHGPEGVTQEQCSSLSDATPGPAGMQKAIVNLRQLGGCSETSENRSVLVAEACRFVFVLVFILDLLLGLAPLLVALLVVYFLPPELVPLTTGIAVSEASLGDCTVANLGPAAFPAGYLVSQPLTVTATFCALRLAPFSGIILALFVSFLHATLLFSQAARLFIPMKPRLCAK